MSSGHPRPTVHLCPHFVPIPSPKCGAQGLALAHTPPRCCRHQGAGPFLKVQGSVTRPPQPKGMLKTAVLSGIYGVLSISSPIALSLELPAHASALTRRFISLAPSSPLGAQHPLSPLLCVFGCIRSWSQHTGSSPRHAEFTAVHGPSGCGARALEYAGPVVTGKAGISGLHSRLPRVVRQETLLGRGTWAESRRVREPRWTVLPHGS